MTASITQILAEEISLVLHVAVAGPLLDEGWPMEQVVAAIKRSADLLPELEGGEEE